MQVFRVELECDVCDTLTTVTKAIACTASALICHIYFSHLMSATVLSRSTLRCVKSDGSVSVLLATKVGLMTGHCTGSVIIGSDRLIE